MTQHKGEWQAKRPPVDRLIQRRSVGSRQQRPGHTSKTHEGEKLNMNHENFVTHRSHHTTSTPLTDEETTTTIRTEATKKQGKVQPKNFTRQKTESVNK